MKTTGNTLLITGATSGIGLGLALRFQAAGNRVVVAGRRTERLEQIVAEHPGIDALELDVADPESIASAFASVTASHPDLNVLINMAGIMQPENLRDSSFLAASEATITTNLLGTLRMTAAFTEFLQQKPDAVIMNVSSGLAFVPLALTPTYNATKAAIHSFTEILRLQLADTSVEVLELIPPAVQTALLGQENDPNAMPLEEFLTEVMDILTNRPDEKQVMVERVGFLRNAESEGRYPEVLAMLAGH
jgi:uncharacterized oxidoreductase